LTASRCNSGAATWLQFGPFARVIGRIGDPNR
jgi:hypothetical protein